MKNTILQNVISNFDLMDKQHFLDWFKENKEWMLKKEKEQIIDAYIEGYCATHITVDSEQYYNDTFKK